MKNKIPMIGALMLLFGCGGSNTEPTQNENETPIINQQEVEQEMAEETPAKMIYVVMETSKGNVTIELDSSKAPITVENFLKYVDAGSYDGTIFHRVISNFMIQGGGFVPDGSQKPTQAPIMLESQTGLKNDIGTLAMARTNAPNSATSQFFINVQKNDFLNYTPSNPGYAVFGKVTAGMDVVNEIRQVPTANRNGMGDWPKEDVVIKTIRRES